MSSRASRTGERAPPTRRERMTRAGVPGPCARAAACPPRRRRRRHGSVGAAAARESDTAGASAAAAAGGPTRPLPSGPGFPPPSTSLPCSPRRPRGASGHTGGSGRHRCRRLKGEGLRCGPRGGGREGATRFARHPGPGASGVWRRGGCGRVRRLDRRACCKETREGNGAKEESRERARESREDGLLLFETARIGVRLHCDHNTC